MRNMVFLVIISGAVGNYGSVCAADAAHCAVDVSAPIIKVADQSAGESDKAIPPGRTNGDGVLAPPNDLDKVPVLKHIVATGPAFWSLARRMGCGASPRGKAINSWCCRFLQMERRSCLALNSIFLYRRF